MPIELIKQALCSRISIKCGLQVARNLRLALRRVGSIETAVEFGLLDLFHSGRTHAAKLDQGERPLAIDLRPFAVWAARRESNQPVVGIEPAKLAVDPSVTKGGVDRFLPRDARDARRRLGQLEPYAFRGARLGLKPSRPRVARRECANRKIGSGLRRRHRQALCCFAPGSQSSSGTPKLLSAHETRLYWPMVKTASIICSVL